MAYEESLRSVSLDADSSLATYTGVPSVPGSANPNYGKQYRFVKVTGRHQVGQVTANTDLAVGVMQNKPQVTGQAATVAIRGISNVMAGAAITPGQEISADANGRAIPKPGTGTPLVLGIAITAASGADELVSVLLRVN
jgi:hypothetical protein